MKKYQYQYGEYFAQFPGGLEDLAHDEVRALGGKSISRKVRGLTFRADEQTLYRINYRSRFITRVLAPLISFKCNNKEDLYKNVRSINWEEFFYINNTFAIFANVTKSDINNSHFASLRTKDAVADYFMDRFGRRPNVDSKDPDVWISIHIRDNNALLSIDCSGGSLHKRGYRKESVAAPMQETLAAAIIEIALEKGSKPVYDPMCGSGTLLSEAYMKYANIPSGYLRQKFGFEFLPGFDPEIWKRVREEEDKKIINVEKGQISGSDADKSAVEAAGVNLNTLPGGEEIELKQTSFNDIVSLENKIIVTNPPYGIRLSRGKDLSAFYKSYGDFLKQKCKGSTAYIFFGEREYIKNLGLKASFKKPFRNGGLEGRLVKIELY